MGTTANFVKLRSTGTPQVGQWNINYSKALAQAKKEGKFIVTCWSNGDKCGYCTAAETCMMQSVFKNWMATSDAYFVFQYSGDKDKGQPLYDWIYNKTKLMQYPGFRVTLYDVANPSKIVYDVAITGNDLRKKKINAYGANEMIAKLNSYFAHKPAQACVNCEVETDYKIRFNEKLTVKKVNQILDAIDANGGYCPCQKKSSETKCHCKDFKEKKKIGEPCICNIYVKQKK